MSSFDGAGDDAPAESAGAAAGPNPDRPEAGTATSDTSPPPAGDAAPFAEHDLSDSSTATDDLAEEIDSELAELSAERDSLRALAQRIQADFENFRRRVQGQMRDEAERAAGRMAEALLPVLDATEAAYLRHPDEVGPLLNLMLGELRKQGLETLDLEGQAFDPNLAEAVAHEPSDTGGPGEVVVAEVLRSGYRWKDRTLRPAMVRTAERAAAAPEAAGTDTEAPAPAPAGES